jgi:hypothetical protein
MHKQSKKSTTVPTNKVLPSKKPIKENPLNGGNNQSVVPTNNNLPKKVIAENGGGNTHLANADLPKDNNELMVQPKVEQTPILNQNEPVVAVNSNDKNKNLDLKNYVKEQLKITAQSELIAVNKPTDLNENISFAESIGLNMLSLFNKVSKRDVKVKKTYNNDGELEKVRLVATGW